MLSRFFSKSKPVHYIIVGGILLLVFIFANLKRDIHLDFSQVFQQSLMFALAMFTIFLFDFLTSKNKLTKKNSYDILMLSLFIALIPETILNPNILISHVFVLLALRRIISLRSKKEIKKKLLDASIWIAIATLFYFWACLFYVLIFLAIIFYALADIKHFIIPIVGTIAVLIISLAYLMITNQDYWFYFNDFFSYSLDFSSLNNLGLIISITLLFSYGNWALFFYIKQLREKKKRYRPAFTLIVFAEIIAMVIVIVSPSKNGSEFLFIMTPFAIIMTNYLENITERWFKELLIWVLIITPVITFII